MTKTTLVNRTVDNVYSTFVCDERPSEKGLLHVAKKQMETLITRGAVERDCC